MMFATGLVVGLFVGMFIGWGIAAVLVAAGRADRQHEIIRVIEATKAAKTIDGEEK